jgi:hypothetical protein
MRSPIINGNYGFMGCRAIPGAHAWEETDRLPISSYTMGQAVGYTFACSRCDAEKDVFYKRNGEVGMIRYRYPEGYKLSSDVTKSALREVVISRKLRRK